MTLTSSPGRGYDPTLSQNDGMSNSKEKLCTLYVQWTYDHGEEPTSNIVFSDYGGSKRVDSGLVYNGPGLK